MFLSRNKKNINTFPMKKVPYLYLWFLYELQQKKMYGTGKSRLSLHIFTVTFCCLPDEALNSLVSADYLLRTGPEVIKLF